MNVKKLKIKKTKAAKTNIFKKPLSVREWEFVVLNLG